MPFIFVYLVFGLFDSIFCTIHTMLSNFFANVAFLSVGAMMYERYWAIYRRRFPSLSKRQATALLFFIWIFPIPFTASMLREEFTYAEFTGLFNQHHWTLDCCWHNKIPRESCGCIDHNVFHLENLYFPPFPSTLGQPRASFQRGKVNNSSVCSISLDNGRVRSGVLGTTRTYRHCANCQYAKKGCRKRPYLWPTYWCLFLDVLASMRHQTDHLRSAKSTMYELSVPTLPRRSDKWGHKSF